MPSALQIHLLGGFSLHRGDQQIVNLDSLRLQALLAYLLLHREAPQQRQGLAFLLWPDTTDAQARSNLRTALHRIRQALPDADQLLRVDTQTVQWCPTLPITLDVADLEDALARADRAGRDGDHTAQRAALERASAAYRGDLLPGWYDDWVLFERERLRVRFLAALEQHIALLEHERDFGAAIVQAQLLLRHDPLHEATCRQLMRLHLLHGDRASAVRVYQTCAAVLERELGVAPAPATEEAYASLLRSPGPIPVPESPSPKAEHPAYQQLPAPLTSFIGRVRERAAVGELLETNRLLTLMGAGGCGKTRLALAVANERAARYRDGVLLVELAPLAEGHLVAQALAAALGVREQPQRPLLATLVETLRDRALLLVLDTCEHLITAVAALADGLLRSCPKLTILATSRERLGIGGETTYRVPSLALPDPRRLPPLADLHAIESIQLFVERATAVLPTFRLVEANIRAVSAICHQLDGIPLAIELAAARVKLLTPEQIAGRLGESLRLLTGGSRTALPRQQTLRAAISWSYALLSEQERAFLRRLAVFAGGWGIEHAEATCCWGDLDGGDLLDLLALLVDKSLVIADVPAAGVARYRLLETVRQFAAERLQEADEGREMQLRHSAAYLALAEQADPQLNGADQLRWLHLLEAEHDNMRAALTWAREHGEVERLLRLCGALYRFWYKRGYLHEGRGWLEAALARWQELGRGAGPHSSVDPALVAQVLNQAGVFADEQGDYVTAIARYEASLALCRELNDLRGMGAALNNLGGSAFAQGDLGRAHGWFAEALALLRAQGDRWRIALALGNLGAVARERGDYAEANACHEESLALLRGLGDTRGVATTLHNIGDVALAQGDVGRAHSLFAESLALLWQLGDRATSAACIEGLAETTAVQGQAAQAARLLGAAAALREAIGAPLPPSGAARTQHAAARARAALGAAAFDAAWAVGYQSPLEETVAGRGTG